jgi:hypothetical protein
MRLAHFFGALAAVIVVAEAGAPVSANDSTVELSVGGLVLKRTTEVSIESEDLSISSDSVAVDYKFLNRGQNPVTLTIAFPLPDIDLSDADNIAIPTSDPVNFVGFQTKIDGQPATFEIVQRAFLGDKDVTDIVRRAKLPLLPLGEHRERISALAPAVRDQLLQQGIIAPSGSDERGRPLYAGSWIVKTSVVRQQTFPPGRPVAVEHRYRTSVGISLDTVLRKAVRESKGMEKEFQRYVKDYCIPNELIRAIDGVAGPAKANIAQLQERRISYILTTGANWAGPIKNFRLVVDKGQEDWLTSFCADNVKKISPTAFEVRIKDFTPERDLKILMIRRGG